VWNPAVAVVTTQATARSIQFDENMASPYLAGPRSR
jgi:hypothetical protein